MRYEITVLSTTIFDEEPDCNLSDLCKLCNVSAELIQDMVNEGLIVPKGSAPQQWHFDRLEIRRIQTAVRLQNDLRVNLPGCALALDLLDELERLRGQRNKQ